MKTISIHQPTYLPWLGFFEKIYSSEIFVFLDDVQYEKNGFQNRNKIRTHEGDMWLTVSTNAKFGTLLKDVTIDNTSNWLKKHLKSISQYYSKSQFFYDYYDELKKIYEKQHVRLIDLNIEIIKFLMEKFNIKTKTIFSSELKIIEQGSNRILEISKALNAELYISGSHGKNYLEINDFKRNNILIKFQDFQHPKYRQVYEPFIPNMASIDLLFNEGKNAENIIKNTKKPIL